MPPVKSAALAACVAVSLSACGSAVRSSQGRGKVDDPRTNNPNRVACLRRDKLPVQLMGKTGIQIGSLPSGPTIAFAPTPGEAQGLQITGRAQGAEVIGAALLYPHGGTEAELSAIETCLSKSVTG